MIWVPIAQIDPMSFQTSIPHKPKQVRLGALQWSLSGHQHVCICYSQEDIKWQLKKISNRRSPNLINICPTNPIQVLNLHEFVCMSFKWYFGQKCKKSMLILGLHSRDRKSTRDKANICNPTMTSSNGNIFRVTGPLCGEFIGLRWLPRTKASDA